MDKKKMALVALCAAGLMGLAACAPSSSGSSKTPTSSAPTTSAPTTSTAPVSTDVSILKGWKDGGDSVYNVTSSDTSLAVSYDKGALDWPSMKLSLASSAASLTGYKKLVMELQVSDRTGGGVPLMLAKFEFNNATTHPAHEAKFVTSTTKTVYEWDLSDQTMSDALQMLIFVDPAIKHTTGKLAFSKLYFSKDAVAASGTTIIGVAKTPVVSTYASGTTFDVMKNFYDGGDFVYSFTEATGKVDVAYSKYGSSYSYFGTIVDNVSTFEYLNMKVKGPEGKSMLVKVENSNTGAVIKEQTVTFTAASVDFTYYFKNNVGQTGKQKVNFFAEPGSEAVSTGTIEFTQLEFSHTALVAEPVNVQNPYPGMNPWDKEVAVNNWKDGGDAKFTVSAASGKTTVAWKDQALTQSWSSVQAPLSGDYSHMTKAVFNLTASAATKMLCKVQGTSLSAEQWVTFTDTTLTQDVVVDLSAKTQADRLSATMLLVFPLSGEDGKQLATGSVIINSAKYTTPVTPVAGTDVYDCLNCLYGPSNYSFTRGSTVKVDYTAAKGEWEAIGFALDSTVDYSAYTKLVVHVDDATSGIKLKFKINDHEEYNIDDLSTKTADFTLTITTAIAAASKSFVACFVNYGVTGAAGSVTFSKLQLAK